MPWRLFIFILLTTACSDKTELIGHWHCEFLDGGNAIHTIDFLENEVAVINLNNVHGAYRGRWNSNKQTLKGYGECGVFNLTYKLQGDSLLIKRPELGDTFVAKKCKQNCCDPKLEFFQSEQLDINLPHIEQENDNVLAFQAGDRFHSYIFLGRPTSIGYESCSLSPHLRLGDKLSTLQDIPLWLEQERIQHHEKIRPRLQCVLFFDSLTSYRVTFDILRVLKAVKIKSVLMAGRIRTSSKDTMSVGLISFHMDQLENLDSMNYRNLFQAQLKE